MKKILLLILSIAALVIIGCKHKNTDTPKVATKATQITPDTSAYVSLIGTVDTVIYTKNNSIYHPMGEGDEIDSVLYYLDTFSVAGNQFRIVYSYPKYDGIEAVLEQYKQNKWLVENVFYMNAHGQTILHNRDIDEDGFIDITVNIRFHNDVYLFNPINKEFYNNDSCVVYDEVYTLDKNRKVYCDIHEGKALCGDIYTKLFTLKNNTRIDLYKLELFNCPDTGYDFNLITKLVLSKMFKGHQGKFTQPSDSLIEIKATPLKKPIDIDKYDYDGSYKYFDHIDYWKSRYKKLLEYK